MASSETIEPPPGPGPESTPPEGPFIRWERVPWEAVAYLALIAVAVAMRMWDLGARAYHYDETIHAFDNWV
ncbi:MAG: hypothetical protein IH860_03585, partial [Chloroflexi bacterium]|nr:hypothetical protein [Chloroflexota bacterium]